MRWQGLVVVGGARRFAFAPAFSVFLSVACHDLPRRALRVREGGVTLEASSPFGLIPRELASIAADVLRHPRAVMILQGLATPREVRERPRLLARAAGSSMPRLLRLEQQPA